MENSNPLTDELTGKAGIQTDHGELGIGDLIVLLLDAVLLIYTGWRSYDFLSTTVPSGFQILALIGLWGLDIGAVAWSLVWIFGSSEKYQDWASMTFFIVDLTGVVLTSLTDSLMYGAKNGQMTNTLSGIAVFVVPLIVVTNVVAGFIYHMTSPQTKARRKKRKSDAEHNRRMQEVADMERDLLYAEEYLLKRQDTLDKATILAEIKTQQDALEKATRTKLRDQIGIHNAASTNANAPDDKLAQLRERINTLKTKLSSPSSPQTDKAQEVPFPIDVPPTNRAVESADPNSFSETPPKIAEPPSANDMAEGAQKNGNGHQPSPF